jgi:hypothetical protein
VDGMGLHEAMGGNPGNRWDPWGLDWGDPLGIQPDLESDVQAAVKAGLLTQKQADEILSQASEAPGKIDRATNVAQHFLEQGYPLGVAGIFTAYWVAADLTGIASIAEGMRGFDVGTQQNLSGLSRGLKVGSGAIDALMSYYFLKATFSNPCPPKAVVITAGSSAKASQLSPKVAMVGTQEAPLKQAIANLPEGEVLSTVYDARTGTLYIGQSSEISHFNLANTALKGEVPSKIGDVFQGGFIYKEQGEIAYKQFSGSINSRTQSVWEAAQNAGATVIQNLKK